ncbi:tyrosine kinase, putative [Entamoeba histolytica HM-1:IMSS-B]|uniref:Tyrosine kinase, putative n=5 Tax=Entamoeba histolytica TaxID=5759 RepID=C4M446_ENTH1|nr:tyrosine kinase, putative [Entamoeba histolytica HM-1:IMSS]EMH76699.1 tyrosine kinase, putative [Entamoeba histolytica HM-1:IMSS-B]EMS11555.1 tyrosine protein kinase, putative [Entamoeba histolytica HM-3:IMSS]ENY62806.1 tyrosine protein kinase, putative [Entamoeba histolytica HM-1:IMSS-A]GAT96121.1 tyrosine kinase putative [Entamoeba histolytica]EAL48394.1 tyrosine kinase, putative [Entamoeba histolytica HM-1:IMSS]|eukprot:XP_653781.1 tyrosine kinase, putative [Entamoeba histolytica HM-1:IMSS]
MFLLLILQTYLSHATQMVSWYNYFTGKFVINELSQTHFNCNTTYYELRNIQKEYRSYSGCESCKGNELLIMNLFQKDNMLYGINSFCSSSWCPIIPECGIYDYHTCECIACQRNYFLTIENPHQCLNLSNFSGCTSADGVFCTTCKDPTYVPNQLTHTCHIPDSSCSVIEYSYCSSCTNGYEFNLTSGQCESYLETVCKEHCISCTGTPYSCHCENGYTSQNDPTTGNVKCLDLKGYDYECQNDQCTSCSANHQLCWTGFSKTPNRMCVPFKYNYHCKIFDSGSCYQCEDNYYIINFNNNAQCLSIIQHPIPHCKIYILQRSNYQGCSICEDGYYSFIDTNLGLIICEQVDDFKPELSFSTFCMEYYLINSDKHQYECKTCGIGYYPQRMTCSRCEYHCIQCISESQCLQCEIGYFVNNGKCEKMNFENIESFCLSIDEIYGCLECSNSNSYGNCDDCPLNCNKCSIDSNGIKNCSLCSSNYELYHGECVSSSLLHCKSYDFIQRICRKCDDGYYNYNGECTICPEGCEFCYLNAKQQVSCNKCSKGYYKKINNDIILCELTINNCKIYQEDYCIECENGYYLDNINECILAPLHCWKYDIDNNKCTVCDLNTNNINGMCLEYEQCEINNTLGITNEYFKINNYCKYFDRSSNKCNDCIENYHVGANGDCIQNNIEELKMDLYEHCLSYTSSGCSRCIDSYYFNYQTKQCEACHNSCKHCSGPSSTECTTCDSSHFFLNGTCENNEELKNKCNIIIGVENSKICLSCKEGFVKQGFECNECPKNCSSCYDQEHCFECKESFYLKNSLCYSYNQLTHCTEKTKNGCSVCENGYYLNDNNECKKCNSHCIECTLTRCKECENEYVLQNGINCVYYQSIDNCIKSIDSKCSKCKGMNKPDPKGEKCVSSLNYGLIIGVPLICILIIIILSALLVYYFINLHFIHYFNKKQGVIPQPISMFSVEFYDNEYHKDIRYNYTTITSDNELEVGNTSSIDIVVGNFNRYKTYEVHLATPIDDIKCSFSHKPECADIPPKKAVVFTIFIKPLICCCITHTLGIIIKRKHSDIVIPIKLHLFTQLDCSLDPDEIIEQKQIGEGTFGSVFKGMFRGHTVAIKRLKISTTDESISEFNKEVELLDKFRCPQIVYFYGAVFNPKRLTIVMEFAPYKSLKSMISNEPSEKFSFKLRAKILCDCAKGLMYLHNNHIIHRDVKSDNILLFDLNLEAPVRAKLTDFGSSRSITLAQSNMTFTKGIGTPIYMAPDLLNNKRYDEKIDVFSFAVVMYETYIWGDVYPEKEFPYIWNIASFIADGKRRPKIVTMEEWFWELINLGWNQNPKERITMEQIVLEFENHGY